MNLKKKEKQNRDFATIYAAKYGVKMDLGYTQLSRGERAIVCLIKGILIFLCVFGSAGLFLTSFDLPGMKLVLFLFILVISMATAMFYYNRLVFNIGYIVFFVLICFLAYSLYWYANSGMNAILNTALKIIDEKLNLNGVREYNEVITNRTVTVTCCLVLISCLMVCLYNSAISGYMSPLFTFLLLYPIAQFCVYFDDSVNYGYLSMMILGFLGVCLLRLSGRHSMPYRGVAPDLRIKGERVNYDSRRFTKTVKDLSVVAAVFLAILLIVAGLLVSVAPKRFKNNDSTWKSGTDAIVEQFALNGLAGFFNHYTANGGLSEGKLGGVRQVVLSFEPQLDVKIVPDNVHGIYLRGFIGDYYEGNQWRGMRDKTHTLQNKYSIKDTETVVNQESNFLEEIYESGENPYSAEAYMTVTNLDAPAQYMYTPYFTETDYSDEAQVGRDFYEDCGDYVHSDLSTKNFELKHHYYPFDTLREQLASGEISSVNSLDELRYRMYVYDKYLYIPSSIRSDLNEICDTYITGSDRESVIEQILTYFQDEFRYTLSPGITPSSRDFVVYFLKQQKKGYCAHFATAAAMLLRSKGIPARYVEGYYIQFTDATEVETLENINLEEWYSGYNATVEGDEEPFLIDVKARGADAHAWVEVYYDGFGWIPVEFTVAASEGSEEGGSFWDRFGGFFGNNESGNSPVENVTEQLQAASPFILALVAAALLVLIVIWLVMFIRRKYKLYHVKSNKRLVLQYVTLSKLLRRFEIASEHNNIYHNRMRHYLVSVLGIEEKSTERYVALVEKASFGNEALSIDELSEATECYRQILRALKRIVTGGKRIRILMAA